MDLPGKNLQKMENYTNVDPKQFIRTPTPQPKGSPKGASKLFGEKNYKLFSGWWFFTNPSEKYARQNGNLPQFSG